MADKLIIDWKEYNLIVEKLAIQIHQSGYKPDILIGIMRGGAPIIDVLSRVFKLKCAYLAVESYSGEGTEDQQGELVFSREMSSTIQEMKGNILLCDDLSDTGVTLNKSFKPSLIKNMTDEEAIEYLSDLRQIGRWSAEMILLFTFNRSNIWPLQDIGLLRAISNNYNKKYFPPKNFLYKLYKKFTPYCSVATWYLWRSIDDEPIQY